MRVRTSLLLLFFCMAMCLGAQENDSSGASAVGRKAGHISGLNTVTAKLGGRQGLGVYLYESPELRFEQPFDSGASVSGDIAYEFVYSRNPGATPSLEYGWPAAFHINALSLSDSLNIPESGLEPLAFTLGRLCFSDPSSLVYSGSLDGFRLDMGKGPLLFSAALGYTGLLLKSDYKITMSRADEGDGGVFCPPRVVGSASVLAPSLFGQRLEAALIAQEDLEGLRSSQGLVKEYSTSYVAGLGGAVDSQYLALSVSGSPLEALSYSCFAIGEGGSLLSYLADSTSSTGSRYKSANILAGALGLNLLYTFSDRLSGEARLRVSSGDADAESIVEGNTAGVSTVFLPITRGDWGLVFSPALSNVSSLEALVHFTPFPGKLVGLESAAMSSHTLLFMKTCDGAASEDEILLKAQNPLLGLEEDLSASAHFLSFLEGKLSAGFFVPFKDPWGAFSESYGANAVQCLLRLDVVVSI